MRSHPSLILSLETFETLVAEEFVIVSGLSSGMEAEKIIVV